MGSEVILRGNVSFHLAPVDTPRPDAPNLVPGAVWAGVFGDSAIGPTMGSPGPVKRHTMTKPS